MTFFVPMYQSARKHHVRLPQSCPHAYRIPSTKYVRGIHHGSLTKTRNAKAHRLVMTQLEAETYDAIVIGSGFGGLSAAILLGKYGYKTLVLESHSVPGGVAHGFTRRRKSDGQEYVFETGPSFYCGLTNNGQNKSLNPLKMVLDVAGMQLDTVRYDRFVFHFGNYNGDPMMVKKLPVFADSRKYIDSMQKTFGADAGREMEVFIKHMTGMFGGMKNVPACALEASLRVLPRLFTKFAPSMLKLLPFVSQVQAPVASIMENHLKLKNPDLRRVIDVECFLLSGLLASQTISAEIAFMVGERQRSATEFPRRGTQQIVDKLVLGVETLGGKVQLNSHVDQIIVDPKTNQAVGVRLKNGKEINAPLIVSNATLKDLTSKLLNEAINQGHAELKGFQNATDALNWVDSFMHINLGIDARGLNIQDGHHAVVLDCTKAVDVPGNTVMVSIASVWDSSLCPKDTHVVHAYTLEHYDDWTVFQDLFDPVKQKLRTPEQTKQLREGYEKKKVERAQSLKAALRMIISDLDERIEEEHIGTPLTHQKYTRRYKGSYGPAVKAPNRFPNPTTPIESLVCVGDSVVPGIGVPAVAASAFLAINSIAEGSKVEAMVQEIWEKS